MCGIVAIASRRLDLSAASAASDLSQVLARIDAVAASLAPAAEAIAGAADSLHAIDQDLRGAAGVRALLADPVATSELERRVGGIRERAVALERAFDDDGVATLPHDIEAVNAALVSLRDALWAIDHDRVGIAHAIDALAGSERSANVLHAYWSMELALRSIDRMEVRGRDSAGVHVLVTGHGLDLADPSVERFIDERNRDTLFRSGSVRVANGHLSFVYKTAAEIGELGDNTATIRAAIAGDDLLRLALRGPEAHVVVVSHTRWASIGVISEANAHPLNSDELVVAGGGGLSLAVTAGNEHDKPYVVAALNGDVDNYADIIAHDGLHIAADITTDAKVIPVMVSRRRAAGSDVVESFRSTVAEFEGSVAIAAVSATDPDLVLLAQRGSGQAVYVGIGDDVFIAASEPYGVVEIANRYVRLDGETMRIPGDPATQGQIVVLDATRAGSVEGIRRVGYEGTELPIEPADVHPTQITTRDVDRGSASHYFWKEMLEAPESFRKTLRGRVHADEAGRLHVALGEESLPATARAALADGAITRVHVIGQGTAAIAGQSLAQTLRRLSRGRLVVDALPATELSGFELRDDMTDTIVIAISQSGTTTDTNRTVDLVRGRGATVLSIVNRRQSDLVDKSDGVTYTSDGRDVEMAVASTKAFYAQIAAGVVLAYAIAGALQGGVPADEQDRELKALRALPDAMAQVIARRDTYGEIARRHAPLRRYWAVVGNGANRVAAAEIRIKLSELCYKSIACDTTEDKKHIDLSAEPMILVCAAGLSGSNADDVGKELAIYRAHKAAPIVIASDGEHRLRVALDTMFVPTVHPQLDFVLAAMAGHVFGYEAALAIHASAVPLREARGELERIVAETDDSDRLFVAVADALVPMVQRFFETLHTKGYDGALEAATAVRLAALFRFATRMVPLELYQLEFGKVGTPSALVEDLLAALTRAIDELTRPVDAIKHQAKTVTVGISRSDETLLRVRLVQSVLESGCARDALSYRALRTLVELDAAVADVTGYTRYRIEGDVEQGAAIHVIDRGGIAVGIPSRTDADPRLRGTKHRAAYEREVTVVRGRADGRIVIHVPEVKDGQAVGLAVMHVRLHERLDAGVARRVLRGYRGRYAAIQDQVTETEPVFRDELLADIDVVELLTEPVVRIAERFRS